MSGAFGQGNGVNGEMHFNMLLQAYKFTSRHDRAMLEIYLYDTIEGTGWLGRTVAL